MRKILFIFALLMGAMHLSAQNEVRGDSIQSPSTGQIKMVGDFMLDMNLMMMPPRLPSLHMNTDMLGPDVTKDYMQLFQLPSQMVLSRTYISNPFYSYGYGYGGFFSTPTTLQTATFKVNDKMRLTTYGQYTLDGKRVPNPAALPWEKNNFMGGMELKFNNNFGIRIEVQQGRNPMYPY